MYAEFQFLFQNYKFNDRSNPNRGDIYNRLPPNLAVFYKNNQKQSNYSAKNSIKDEIYSREADDMDPYVKLLEEFNGENSARALKLRPADLAYLTDLGVYPLNRLIILRRFPDGTVVPGNLSEWGNDGPEPIATIIGWAKEGSNELFSFGFSESWINQTNTIDKVFAEIMQKEFGFNTEKITPQQGWSQGFLWGFLNESGLSQYDWNEVPQGDPNVLKTAKMRDIVNQGLETTFSLTVETEYEQKFISDIDPSKAMVDIINNLTRFGTSDMKYYLRVDPNTMPSLLAALNSTGTDDIKTKWVDFIKKMATAFFTGIKNSIDTAKEQIIGATNVSSGDGSSGSSSTSGSDGSSGSSGTSSKPLKIEIPTIVSSEGLLNLGNFIINTLLAGSIMKYVWPLKGSLAMMTGLPTTPWHITIGNPYQPVLSLNNIVVDGVTIKPNTEMGFGDMPTKIKTSVNVSLGRPLGKQEIDRAFNNSYRRIYSVATSTDMKTTSQNAEIFTDNKGKATSLEKILENSESTDVQNKTVQHTGANVGSALVGNVIWGKSETNNIQ